MSTEPTAGRLGCFSDGGAREGSPVDSALNRLIGSRAAPKVRWIPLAMSVCQPLG